MARRKGSRRTSPRSVARKGLGALRRDIGRITRPVTRMLGL